MDMSAWPTHVITWNGGTPLFAQCEMKNRLNEWTLPVPPENSVGVDAQGLTHFASCHSIGYDFASQTPN